MKVSGLVAFICLSLLACSLLIACGDDGDDDDSDNSDATPATTGEASPGDETAISTDETTPGEDATAPSGDATAPQGSGGTEITAVLTNTPFSITLSDETVAAGDVDITVTNEGTVGHNFWLIRTDLSADDLPVTNNVVNVGSLDVVANSALVTNDEDIEPGDQLEVQLPDLEAGAYVVICNVPDHYTAGMQASLTVQ